MSGNADRQTRPPLETAAALHAALEAGRHGEELRDLFTTDATTIEHPNQLRSGGAVLDLEEILAGSVVGANLLEWQQFDVHQVVENGTEVVLRVT